MSRNKKAKNSPISHDNCVTVEKQSIRDIALKQKHKHDNWESKQRFEVKRIDAKTIVYRLIKAGEKVKAQIHKGRI